MESQGTQSDNYLAELEAGVSPEDEQELENEIVNEIETEGEEIGKKPDNPYNLTEAGTSNFSDFQWKNFSDKLRILPETIKNIFFDSETEIFLEEICQENGFSDNQSEILTQIVRGVLFGDIFLGNMVNLTVEKLQISAEDAQKISNKIVSELFAPAINEIKIIQRKFINHNQTGPALRPAPPPPSLIRTTLPQKPASNPTGVNQNNIIDLRNQNQQE